MAMRFTAKIFTGVAMCAALMLTGCMPPADDSALIPESESERESVSAPAAVPASEVLAAVQAAATVRDLPPTITNDALLATSGDYTEQWGVEGCKPDLEVTRLDDLEPCTLGDPDGERTMVVIGDSAASMWHEGFDLIGKRNGWRVLVLAKSNCGPAALTYYQYQLEREYTECDVWQDWRMQTIAAENADIVVLTGAYDGGNQGPGRHTTPQIWRDALVQTIEQLPAGTAAVLLGNIPRPAASPSDCLAENPSDITRCATPAAEALPDQTPWAEAAAQTGQTYVDIDPWFCTEVCPAVIADQLVYAGRYHISGQYAQYLSGAIEEAMAPALTAPR